MSEFTPLREAADELAGRAPAPDFDELKRRATRRGRRRVVLVSVAGILAFIAVGGAVAARTLGSSDQVAPIGEPTSPTPTATQESIEPTPPSLPALAADLETIVAQVPGWAIADNLPDDYDYAFNGPCSGGLDDWGRGSVTGGDGGVGRAGIGGLGFPSRAQASDAAARLVDNLESCTITEWRTQPIAQTAAVLAYSADAVTWIQHTGRDVRVLQMATTDGPPPATVQVEVAEWMDAYSRWQDQDD